MNSELVVWKNLVKWVPLLILSVSLMACGSTAAPEDTTPKADVVVKESSGLKIPTSTPATAKVEEGKAKPVGVLRIALDEIGPPRWIPKLQGAPQNSINNTTFTESIWAKGTDGSLEGVLLDSWDISDDGTTWTLRFRKGFPFHFGYGEFTAKDFIWTMENAVE